MKLELEHKTVLITGATGGIGRQIVADFLSEGSVVICLIRNEGKMNTLREELSEANYPIHNLHNVKCDILNYDDIQEAVKAILKMHSRIDILVNCAGFAIESPLALNDQEQIDRMIVLNMTSPIYLCQAVLKPMFRQKEGCIINISSVSAVKKGRGISVYAGAKAGIEAFSRALSQEIGRKNIRINCIRPGVISTSMSEAVIERANERIKTDTALGRFGVPSEISKAVLFVASNNTSSYMTGECISIDGGLY